ncbi:DNA-binding protein [Streptomyces sp. M7]|nr:DNA-binding protein [Streptomyces sp. M7]
MTQVYVTSDTPPHSCVTTKPQVRRLSDADDAGDAEIRTSDTHGLPTHHVRRCLIDTALDRPDPRAILRGGLPDRYLTPDDIAEIFEVPKETVYQWRKKRIGPPGFRIGKYVRYDPADVRAYVTSRKDAEINAA